VKYQLTEEFGIVELV